MKTMAKKKAEEQEQAQPDPHKKEQVPVRFERQYIEYLRDVAWWERKTIQEIIEAGTRAEVERLEEKNKGKFKKREGKIRPGRRAE